MLQYVNHGDVVRSVVASLNNGRVIDAIKDWRAHYGVGLKEAKDAVEAIRDALGLKVGANIQTPQYIVISKYNEFDYDYSKYTADDRADAFATAQRMLDEKHDVIVAQVVSKTVVTKTLQPV